MNGKVMWLVGLLLTLTGGSAGFGISQMAIVSTVASNRARIDNLEKRFDQEQVRTDQRIFKLADMVENANSLVRESITQNSKLVDTIMYQNRMIQDLNKIK